MWANLILFATISSYFAYASPNLSTNDVLLNLNGSLSTTRLQTILVNVDTRRTLEPNNTIDTAALTRAISRLDEIVARLMIGKDHEDACRASTVTAELVTYTSEALKVKINTAISTIEEKIAALQSRMNTPSVTGLLDTRTLNLGPADYRSKGRGVYYESKNNLVIGLPWIFGYLHGLWDGFTVTETLVPMASSGSKVIQVAYAGNEIRIRDEDLGRANTWTTWRFWSS